jgi:hypothetical protein
VARTEGGTERNGGRCGCVLGRVRSGRRRRRPQIRKRGHHGRTAEARHSVCGDSSLRPETDAFAGGQSRHERGVSDGALPIGAQSSRRIGNSPPCPITQRQCSVSMVPCFSSGAAAKLSLFQAKGCPGQFVLRSQPRSCGVYQSELDADELAADAARMGTCALRALPGSKGPLRP